MKPTLAGNLNIGNIALAGQAAEIIKSIPGQVTGSEYLAVANALYFSGLFDLALELYQAGASLKADQVTHAVHKTQVGLQINALTSSVNNCSPAR